MAIIFDIYYYDVDAYIDYIGEETADVLPERTISADTAMTDSLGNCPQAMIINMSIRISAII